MAADINQTTRYTKLLASSGARHLIERTNGSGCDDESEHCHSDNR
jgi:hypothetical protein